MPTPSTIWCTLLADFYLFSLHGGPRIRKYRHDTIWNCLLVNRNRWYYFSWRKWNGKDFRISARQCGRQLSSYRSWNCHRTRGDDNETKDRYCLIEVALGQIK